MMLQWLVLQIPIYMGVAAASPATQATCDADRAKKFLGIFPTWYAYIRDYEPKEVLAANGATETVCAFGQDVVFREHAVQVGLALIDILLRAGALAAVAFVIMGGYRYISSQGEPKNIEAAMATIVNAAIGLGIVITSTVLVSFIGSKLG